MIVVIIGFRVISVIFIFPIFVGLDFSAFVLNSTAWLFVLVVKVTSIPLMAITVNL